MITKYGVRDVVNIKTMDMVTTLEINEELDRLQGDDCLLKVLDVVVIDTENKSKGQKLYNAIIKYIK